MLSILRSYQATATFFELGRQQLAFPDAVRAVRAEGSSIGNHTYDHADLSKLDDSGIRREVEGGPKGSACVRPPYGAVTPKVRRVLAEWASG